MRSEHRSLLVLPALLGLALVFGGCGREAETAVPPRRPVAPEVAVHVVEPQRVAITTDLPGRVSAHLVAEVRPQVGGIIEERLFEEGADVTAGQVLYRIDPSRYRAAYASAKAALARAKAGYGSAKAALARATTARATAQAALSRAEANAVPLRLKAQRLEELLSINAVSRQDFDDASAAVRQAEAGIDGAKAAVGSAEAEITGAEAAVKAASAEIEGAEAALETARINLAYTRVTAPIGGRIGKSAVTVGALVTAGQPVALATIQQLDPVYVDVTQSTANLLRLRRSLAAGELKAGDPEAAKVRLVLEDDSPYPLDGTLSFSDVTVEQGTGSVTLRTVFPNPDQVLLPGMYVRAIVEEGVKDAALLVPQQGVTRDAAGNATALVVGAGDTVERRTLTISRAIGDNWLVEEGLTAGDRVIVEGLQKVRPGAAVRVVTLSPPEADGGTSSASGG